jgi:hypothetical protein
MTTMAALDLPTIRDADLVKRLADVQPLFRDLEIRRLEEEQQRRDAVRALPRNTRRRAETQHLLQEEGGGERDNLRHIHSVLAICALPYQSLPLATREWERTQGNMRLKVLAGELTDPNSGEWVPQPVPSGSRARLVLLHICSEAIRNKSPTVEVGDSLSAFIRSMGIAVTGGKNGSINSFKQQINALVASDMRFGLWNGERSRTIKAQPFTAVDIWLPQVANQKMLWPEKLTLGDQFYATLTKHAMPVNLHAVRAFAGSPRKLDLYFWISYRYTTITRPVLISWNGLKEQFGTGYKRDRRFRTDFADEIREIKEVFPKLPVKIDESGFTIYPGAAEVLAIPTKPRK